MEDQEYDDSQTYDTDDNIEDTIDDIISDDESDNNDDTIQNSIISNSIVSNDETYIKINNSNINNPYLTKFELTKLLSIRTQQIARGSSILIDIDKDFINNCNKENKDIYYEIARLEFKNNKCPLMIRRYTNNNKYIDIKINSLINKYNY